MTLKLSNDGAKHIDLSSAIGITESKSMSAIYISAAKYVDATNGNDSWAGTFIAPWQTIEKARVSSLAGDTIFFRSGTYVHAGEYEFIWKNYRTLEAFPDEIAIIDGPPYLRGIGDQVIGMQITKADIVPRNVQAPNPNSIYLNGGANKIIDLILHDCKMGAFNHSDYGNDVIYDGCIIYDNGYILADRGHGHGIYCQNGFSAPLIVRNCIIFDNFGLGIHAYGEALQKMDNIQLIDNICFKAGSLSYPTFGPYANILLGGSVTTSAVNNPVWHGNMTYGGSTNRLGYDSPDVVNGLLEDNYLPEGVTIVGSDTTLINNVLAPEATNRVFAIWVSNTYDRYHVAIYNWEHLNSVVIPAATISTHLSVGDHYSLTNVQDLFVDIATGIVAGDGTVTVDMQASSHTVSTPAGWVAPAKTFPEFGCFILKKI
jgi:hypothetical protein